MTLSIIFHLAEIGRVRGKIPAASYETNDIVGFYSTILLGIVHGAASSGGDHVSTRTKLSRREANSVFLARLSGEK